jgi:uncharacterized protein YjeT (DUF2065 family)
VYEEVNDMIWLMVVSAVGLLFVFEGILPFLSPKIWRLVIQQMLIQSDKALRIIGLVSMLIGLLLVSIARDLN